MLNSKTPFNFFPVVCCVGRDGSTSFSQILNSFVAKNNLPWVVKHEYKHHDIYQLLDRYRSYKSRCSIAVDFLDELHSSRIINVGAGFSFLLQYLPRDMLGSLRVIHLQRNLKHWIPSMIKVTTIWNHNAWNYFRTHPQQGDKNIRLASYHFDEQTKGDWDVLPLRDKLTWYYTYQQNEVISYSSHFSSYDFISTSDISTDKTISTIISWLNLSQKPNLPYARPELFHVNKSSSLKFDRFTTNRFFKDFDFDKSVDNIEYLVQYALEKASTGYACRHRYEHSSVSEEELKKIISSLKQFIANHEHNFAK